MYPDENCAADASPKDNRDYALKQTVARSLTSTSVGKENQSPLLEAFNQEDRAFSRVMDAIYELEQRLRPITSQATPDQEKRGQMEPVFSDVVNQVYSNQYRLDGAADRLYDLIRSVEV